MITVEDCLHFSPLNPEEIDAIAMHERLDEVVACELAAELGASPRGCRTIIQYFVDDILDAERQHDYSRSYRLHRALNAFADKHGYL